MRADQSRVDFSGTVSRAYAEALRARIAEADSELTSAIEDVNMVRSVLTRFVFAHPEFEGQVDISRIVNLDDAHSAVTAAKKTLEYLRSVLDEHAAGNDNTALNMMGVPRPQKRKRSNRKKTDTAETVEAPAVKSS